MSGLTGILSSERSGPRRGTEGMRRAHGSPWRLGTALAAALGTRLCLGPGNALSPEGPFSLPGVGPYLASSPGPHSETQTETQPPGQEAPAPVECLSEPWTWIGKRVPRSRHF